MVINVNKGFRWRPFQFDFVYAIATGAKRICEVQARQHGKTEAKLQYAHNEAFTHFPRPNLIPEGMILMSTKEQVTNYYVRPLDNWFKVNNIPEKMYKFSTTRNHISFYMHRPWYDDKFYIDFGGMKNLDAIRGGTKVFVIIDEAHSAPHKAYDRFISPMGDDTNAMLMMIGTASRLGFFKASCDYYQEMQKTDPFYRYIGYDAISSRFRTDAFLRRKFLERVHSGNEDTWYSEYMNDWAASSFGESPFAYEMAAMHTRKSDRMILSHPITEDRHKLYVSMDMGAPQNQPMVFFKRSEDNNFYIVGYDESPKKTMELPKLLMDQWGDHYNIEVFMPFDVNRQSSEFGSTIFSNLQSKIADLGLTERITLRSLAKSTDRHTLIRTGMENVSRIFFLEQETAKLRERLQEIRFRVDPNTGHVLFGEFVRNSARHTGDAFCYAVYAMLNHVQIKNFNLEKDMTNKNFVDYSKNMDLNYLSNKLKRAGFMGGNDGAGRYWTTRH